MTALATYLQQNKSIPTPAAPPPQPGLVGSAVHSASNFFNNLAAHLTSIGMAPINAAAGIGVGIYNAAGAIGNVATGQATPEQGIQQLGTPHNIPGLGQIGGINTQAPFTQGAEQGFNAAAGVDTAMNLPALASGASDILDSAKGVFTPKEVPAGAPTTPTPPTNPYDIPAAQAARDTASTNAVQGINTANQTAQSDLSQMGQEFGQTGQNIATAHPDKGITLSNKDIQELNSLKESKSFQLPDELNTDNNPALDTTSKFGQIKISPENQKILDANNASGATKLNAAKTQDLITRLNKLTYDAKAAGDLKINQQSIGLTNRVKGLASEAFKGTGFDEAYAKYSAGRGVLEKLDGIVNLDPKASPTDLMKQFNTIAKLHESPEGSKLLDQAVQAYKAERGIDLTDPVGAVNQVLKSQGQLEIAQKGSYMTQLKRALKSPSMAARRIAYLGVSVLGLATVGTAFRKQIGAMFSGQ